MATLLLFGPARTAAGHHRVTIDAATLDGLRDAACSRFGPEFAKVLGASALWVNGEPAAGDRVLGDGDEVAVVPPVSGGA
jgi:molybdopterin converting factor small subunit